MKLNFNYNREKDIENFIKSARSKNNPAPTVIMKEYVHEYGSTYSPETLHKFLSQHPLTRQVTKAISTYESDWQKIEEEFIQISEDVFSTKIILEDITAYISLNSRCTYNIDENYFFVSISPHTHSNHVIMHELLHFYTWQSFGRDMIDKGNISPHQYNDIKESLTVLLNIEYKHLMGGSVDDGYVQHSELRKQISNQWRKSKNLNKVLRTHLKAINHEAVQKTVLS